MTKTGFIYKGRHSDEFGIVARTKSRPILPDQKRHEVDAPNIDGNYDFSASNADGRIYYEDRIIEVEISFLARDIYRLQEKVSQIAVWLAGSGDLSFDDLPTTVWKAKVVQQLDFAPILSGRATSITVYFKCRAWSENEFDTKGPILNSRIPVNSDVPLDLSLDYTFDLKQGANTIRFDNLGSWYIRPVFEIEATSSVTNIALKCNSESQYTLQYTGGGKRINIDCLKQRITVNDVPAIDKVTGKFPEFPPGENAVTIQVGSGSGSLFIRFKPLFVYGYSWIHKEGT